MGQALFARIILGMRMLNWAFPQMRKAMDALDAQRRVTINMESRVVWILGVGLAAAGVLLRLQRYFLGRSFRADEAALALAINGRSLIDLISRPLGGAFTAPVGFLASEKLIVQILGTQDFIFRIIPLLAGVLSVALFYWFSQRVVGDLGAIFCIGAFSLNWFAAFYASDLKQYSGDILFALIVLICASRYFDAETAFNAWILAIAGLVAVSFSHPAIFLLSCVGPVLIVKHYRRPGALKRVAAIGLFWIVAFLVLYILFYYQVGQQAYIVDYWNDLNGIMPMPPWKDPTWFVTRTGSFITTVLILSRYIVVVLALYAAGIYSFFSRRKWQWAVWLPGSILVTLLASAVANYPFKGRLILFLVPGTLLVIGEGLEWVASLAGSHLLLRRALLWLMTLFLLWTPAMSIVQFVQEPRSAPYPEDIKPALAFVQANAQPSDLVVVYAQASTPYKYYAPFFDLANNPTIYLPDYRKQPNKYRGMIDALPRNQRVWFVYSAVLQTKTNEDERQLMLDYVRSSGGHILAEHAVSDGISSAHLVVLR